MQRGERIIVGLVSGAVAGVLIFLMELAGWRGKFEIWDDPQPMADIWWHLPLWVVSLSTLTPFLLYIDELKPSKKTRDLFWLALVMSLVLFLSEVVGYTPWNRPQPSAAIWWHFPLLFLIIYGSGWWFRRHQK